MTGRTRPLVGVEQDLAAAGIDLPGYFGNRGLRHPTSRTPSSRSPTTASSTSTSSRHQHTPSFLRAPAGPQGAPKPGPCCSSRSDGGEAAALLRRPGFVQANADALAAAWPRCPRTCAGRPPGRDGAQHARGDGRRRRDRRGGLPGRATRGRRADHGRGRPRQAVRPGLAEPERTAVRAVAREQRQRPSPGAWPGTPAKPRRRRFLPIGSRP